MRFGGKGRVRDRSVIHYNDRITLSGIPEEAYRYQLGSRSAIEWIIDRYYIKTDKASGIVPNVTPVHAGVRFTVSYEPAQGIIVPCALDGAAGTIARPRAAPVYC